MTPSAAGEAAAEEASRAEQQQQHGSSHEAHTAELQAVKARAVKKIRGLEAQLKAATDESAHERAAQRVLQLVLASEIGMVESDVGSMEAISQQLASQQQQELTLSGSLQALQLANAELEDAHAQEISALSHEIATLQEERQRALDAQAAAAVEMDKLRGQSDAARQAEADARAHDCSQKEKISKLKALLADARVLIKNAPAAAEPHRVACDGVTNGVGAHVGDAVAAAVSAAHVKALTLEVRQLERALEHVTFELQRAEAAAAATRASTPPPPPPPLTTPTPSTPDAPATPDAGAAAALRKELSEVRQRARRLMEEKDKELGKMRKQMTQSAARVTHLEQQVREAEARAEHEAAERAAADMNAAAERAAAGRASNEQRIEMPGEGTGTGTTASHAPLVVNDTIPTQSLPRSEPSRAPDDARNVDTRPRDGAAKQNGTNDSSSGIALSLLSSGGGTSTEVLLHLAQQQAARDAHVNDVKRELARVREDLAAMSASEAALRDKLRETEMSDRRAAASADYIKCLVLKLLQSDEDEQAALFPALATCLQFSEADVQGLTTAREARRSSGGILSSLVGRSRPAAGLSIDRESAEKAVELTSRAQLLARRSDLTAIETLTAQVRDLDDELARLLMSTAKEEHEARARLATVSANMSAQEEEHRVIDEQRRAEANERLYLRNVLLRYMENEDHETMFPVVAMCLKFSEQEVAAIYERRACRERERRRGWRGLFLGST